MAPEFARLAAMVADSNIRHLSNAVGQIGGVAFQGIYRREWAPMAMLGQQVGGETFSVDVLDAVVPAAWSECPLTITEGHGVGAYRVMQAHPDGLGLTRLFLEVAP